MNAEMELMEATEGSEQDRETVTDSEENLGLEEEECFFQDIDTLLEQGISNADIARLKRVGINTIKGIQMTIRKKLLEIKGFDEEKIKKIKEACCKVSLTNGFMTALEVCDQRKQVFKLTTGSKNFE